MDAHVVDARVVDARVVARHSAFGLRRQIVWLRFIIFVSVCFVCVLAAELAFSIFIASGAYKESAIDAKIYNTQKKYARAVESLNLALSPQNIAKRATDMGMVLNTNVYLLDVDRDKIVLEVSRDGVTGPRKADPLAVDNALLAKNSTNTPQRQKDRQTLQEDVSRTQKNKVQKDTGER